MDKISILNLERFSLFFSEIIPPSHLHTVDKAGHAKNSVGQLYQQGQLYLSICCLVLQRLHQDSLILAQLWNVWDGEKLFPLK